MIENTISAGQTHSAAWLVLVFFFFVYYPSLEINQVSQLNYPVKCSFILTSFQIWFLLLKVVRGTFSLLQNF